MTVLAVLHGAGLAGDLAAPARMLSQVRVDVLDADGDVAEAVAEVVAAWCPSCGSAR